MPLPFIGKSHKSPPEIVKNLKESLSLIEKGEKKSEKAAEEVSRWLQAYKGIIYGLDGQEPHPEQVSGVVLLICFLLLRVMTFGMFGSKVLTAVFRFC